MKSRYRIHNIKNKEGYGYFHLPQVYTKGKWWYIICNHMDGGGTCKIEDITIIHVNLIKKLKDYNVMGSMNEEFAKKVIEHHKEHYVLDMDDYSYEKYTYID